MFPTVANTTTDLSAMLGQSQVTKTEQGTGGKSFIRFDPDSGDYTFGKEAEDITDEEIVVNTMSFSHGWTLWHNNKPTKREVHFTQPLPTPMDSIVVSEKKTDHPEESRSFEARFSDDEDIILSYGTTTYGGKKGSDTLLDAIMLKSAGGEKVFLFPVVKLTSESYANSKRGGKLTFNPIFAIVDWMDAEGNKESDTAKIEKPKGRKAKKAAKSEAEDDTGTDNGTDGEASDGTGDDQPAPKKKRRSKATS